ncbi:RDD family protein [Corynebacterium choanae]|uniref:RDD family protein n=1 Tax=Corynebacterium choanae TaxID=1862358 RepID=A0A3G6J7G7_9CORY|nr:RDD family protein [Corynebacterium choanae]AZA13997.1 RDD family protein [Corynebacterium choanae]
METPRSSWLNGPQLSGVGDDDPHAPSRWPGEKLGLPRTGAGALASVMRRVGGLTIDWIISMLAALVISGENLFALLSGSFDVDRYNSAIANINQWTTLCFVVIGTVSVALVARTPGQALMRMGVARIDDGDARVGLWRALVRTFLTILLFPPIIVDSDGRGIHDRLTKTAVILG